MSVARCATCCRQVPDSLRWRLATLPDGFDVRSRALARHIGGVQPDAVLHLGGLTSVAESFRDPDQFFDVNFNGTWNLLKALRAASFTGRLLFVSSGDCYGAVDADDLPVRETHPMRPRNPYAVSKVAAESLCYQWTQTEELDVVLSRSFNHLGPRSGHAVRRPMVRQADSHDPQGLRAARASLPAISTSRAT